MMCTCACVHAFSNPTQKVLKRPADPKILLPPARPPTPSLAHSIPSALTEGEAKLEREDLNVGEVEEEEGVHGVAPDPARQHGPGELLHEERGVHGDHDGDGPGDDPLGRRRVLLCQLRRVVEAACCCNECVCVCGLSVVWVIGGGERGSSSIKDRSIKSKQAPDGWIFQAHPTSTTPDTHRCRWPGRGWRGSPRHSQWRTGRTPWCWRRRAAAVKIGGWYARGCVRREGEGQSRATIASIKRRAAGKVIEARPALAAAVVADGPIDRFRRHRMRGPSQSQK
jgi:hypothetical protein